MSTIYFFNVKNGDCSWIRHDSGRETVIDVCSGNLSTDEQSASLNEAFAKGNYHQKNHAVNPISYMECKKTNHDIFRFILTHPDMDHMDGLENLFETFDVQNFWDSDNEKEMDDGDWGEYRKEDWEYYQKIRKSEKNPCILRLLSGASSDYYRQDGFTILAPTQELVDSANETGDYNCLSYVLLLKDRGRKIIFGGDSGKEVWDYILDEYSDEVSDVDILFAPHHGRKTGGNDDYLDVLQPKLTLFGNAPSEYLDYDSWNNRNLLHYTNNQGGTFILKVENTGIQVYCTNEKFAKAENPYASYDSVMDAWTLTRV